MAFQHVTIKIPFEKKLHDGSIELTVADLTVKYTNTRKGRTAQMMGLGSVAAETLDQIVTNAFQMANLDVSGRILGQVDDIGEANEFTAADRKVIRFAEALAILKLQKDVRALPDDILVCGSLDMLGKVWPVDFDTDAVKQLAADAGLKLVGPSSIKPDVRCDDFATLVKA